MREDDLAPHLRETAEEERARVGEGTYYFAFEGGPSGFVTILPDGTRIYQLDENTNGPAE